MSVHGEGASWSEGALKRLHNKINHRNFTLALDDVMSSLVSAYPGEVVCLTGPSRVGKSRVIGEVIKMLVPEGAFNEGRRPVVSMVASNTSTSGSFSTKTFAINALDAIGHPFYNMSEYGDVGIDQEQYRKLDRISEGAFRNALENAFRAREVKYFVIDEAHHPVYAKGGESSAAAIFDSWKCLAESTGVVLVLVGAYPLVDALSMSPHLAGRAHQCHMPRYHMDDDDFEEYARILKYYSSIMPIDSPRESLLDWGSFIYSKTFGCIGLLNIWLRDAVNFSSIRGESALTFDSMQKKVKAPVYLKRIEDEIRHGESMLGTDSDYAEHLPTVTAKKRKEKPFQTSPRRYKRRN